MCMLMVLGQPKKLLLKLNRSIMVFTCHYKYACSSFIQYMTYEYSPLYVYILLLMKAKFNFYSVRSLNIF